VASRSPNSDHFPRASVDIISFFGDDLRAPADLAITCKRRATLTAHKCNGIMDFYTAIHVTSCDIIGFFCQL
jgi:hypothetical protein